MAESSLPFLLTPEQHRVNDTAEVYRVVRAVDTTDGQLSIDLIFKVEGEDGLRASIYQTFYWRTNPVHKMEQGSRTSSHAADSVKFSERARNSKSKHVSHLGESVICD